MSYRPWGQLAESRRLVDLAPQLSPVQSERGYATTDRAATVALFEPLLRETFRGSWIGASLAIIWQHGSIYPHADGDDGGKFQRYLAVLQTNPEAWCLHDGSWQQLDEGQIYSMDPTRIHAAINWGIEPRVHLVVDIAK